jgi:hypothetical protein
MKEVEVTLKVVIEVDENVLDIDDLDNILVVCFRNEDKYGNETFLPKDEGLTVVEYISTSIDSVKDV